MMDGGDLQERDAPPAAFANQVKQALDHLYDLDYLEKNPLLLDEGIEGRTSGQIVGQHLRRELSAAIESLNPGAHVPFAAPPARVYNLVSLRYVERRSVLQAAQELSLSERQAHRDLRHGEERVAAQLWARRFSFPQMEPRALQLSSFEAEMALFENHPRPTDVCQLVRCAQEVVESQAAQRGVRFHVKIPKNAAMLSLDPVMAEQVLVNTLSRAVEQAHPSDFALSLAVEKGQAMIVLRYFVDPGIDPISAIDLVILQLVDRLGWTVRQTDQPEGSREIMLQISAQGPTVLVVDDNEGLVNLLERYLTDQACRVIAASNGLDGLRMAREALPDAIILDVMMPEMHGWEFLQRLRAQPALAHTPVIICSVINNPRLAYSLGASLFLPKPVRRHDILEALHQVGVT